PRSATASPGRDEPWGVWGAISGPMTPVPGFPPDSYHASQKGLERGGERLRSIDRDVVIGARNLDELGVAQGFEHASRHLQRQNGRMLAAHQERGRGHTGQKRPAVHRLAVGIARGIEAKAEAAIDA